MNEHRTEHDGLGAVAVPAEAYYGIHTARAEKNFAVAGRTVSPALLRAMALVKKACALANRELGYIDGVNADAIVRACDEIAEGKLADQFPVDALQGGAGTSTNMNVNEVIANRAIEHMGGRKGDYSVIHPLDHVNLHQSTNDVYPTALKVAAIYRLRELSKAVAALQGVFQKKEKEFAGVVKIGRTELQEAVPLTLGAQFSGFAEAFGRDRWRTFKCEERLRVVNIGGTAVGTGLAAPRNYIFLVNEKLREVTGLGLARGENTVDQTANLDSFVEVSGILKAHAANLMRAANDLRLMNLLGEIELPAVQAGSSIMPGKVNPVVLECVIQAAMKVIANDSLVTGCAASGTQQIVEFVPLLAAAFLESLDLLEKADLLFTGHVEGIAARPDQCRYYFDRSPSLVTAFVPHIGYDRAAEIIKEFDRTGAETVREFLARKLGAELVDRVLSPWSLTALGYDDKRKP